LTSSVGEIIYNSVCRNKCRLEFRKRGLSRGSLQAREKLAHRFLVFEFGERKRINTGTRKSAEKILIKIRAEIVENRYLDVRKKKKAKFKKLADPYLEYAKTNKRSWTKDKTSLRSLWSHFGDKHLCEISPLSIEECKNIRRRQVTPATVNRELACLKHMFNKAIECGR
jgi:hypothetical protein